MITPRPHTDLEQDRSAGPRPLLVINTPDWMTEAACRGTSNPDQFYPTAENVIAYADAIQVCLRCPVRHDCLAYALDKAETEGIWGGMAAPTRRSILRKRKRDVA